MKLWLDKGGWASKKGREKVKKLEYDKVRKVAVIRHAALGDMVIARPFLVELRRFFPKAEITLSLVTNYTYGAPEDLVDRMHVVYGNDRRDVPIKVQYKKVKELGEQDIIFDLAATSRSYWVCALNRAKLKVGFPYAWYRNLLFYDISVFRTDYKFEGEVLLDMLNILGFRTASCLDYALPKPDDSATEPYIVYFPSASTPLKCWPHKSFAELVENMAKLYPEMRHQVLEGVGEDESVDDIVGPLSHLGNVQSVKPKPIDETINYINNASLLISNDTGIRNMAIATNTPTVGIFFATVPFRYWPKNGLHEVVFNLDGTIPSAKSVFQSAVNHLKAVSQI